MLLVCSTTIPKHSKALILQPRKGKGTQNSATNINHFNTILINREVDRSSTTESPQKSREVHRECTEGPHKPREVHRESGEHRESTEHRDTLKPMEAHRVSTKHREHTEGPQKVHHRRHTEVHRGAERSTEGPQSAHRAQERSTECPQSSIEGPRKDHRGLTEFHRGVVLGLVSVLTKLITNTNSNP